MAAAGINPINQIAKAGENWSGKGGSEGTYLYVPTVTARVATLSKYDTQGKLLWESNLSGGLAAASSTSQDDSVFVASGSAGITGKTSALAKFSATGEKLWEVTSSLEYLTDVAINGSTVYVSGRLNAGINSANTAFINAYLLENGQLIWSKKYTNSRASTITNRISCLVINQHQRDIPVCR